MSPLSVAKWVGTVTGIAGCVLVDANLSVSKWGLVLYLCSSVCWTVVATKTKERSLCVMSGVYTALNLFGIYRWFS
jgi:hypothetical protein